MRKSSTVYVKLILVVQAWFPNGIIFAITFPVVLFNKLLGI